jgi:hypothetical protein
MAAKVEPVWIMGKERPPRNPITNDKTPRRNFIGWEFTPPAAPPVKSRWVEPEQQMSILDKLASQQSKINAEKQWQKESNARIAAYEESKRREQLLKLQESGRSLDGGGSGHADESNAQRGGSKWGNHNEEHQSSFSGGGGHGSAHAEAGQSQSRLQSSGARLMDIPVSHIRSLQKTCPAVLERYRAQRAQEFIKHTPDPDPRAPRKKPEEHRSSFRPGGILQHTSPKKGEARDGYESMLSPIRKPRRGVEIQARKPEALTPLPTSEAALLVELKLLASALENTNEEIERQTLRMALSKKMKTYEKKSSTT